MLTLTAMFATERQGVPRVAYITYLDVWMVVCILFVFVELVEFSWVNYLNKGLQQSHRDVNPSATRHRVEKIEKSFKILLPVAFIVFNIVYWAPILKGYY